MNQDVAILLLYTPCTAKTSAPQKKALTIRRVGNADNSKVPRTPKGGVGEYPKIITP